MLLLSFIMDKMLEKIVFIFYRRNFYVVNGLASKMVAGTFQNRIENLTFAMGVMHD